MSSQGASGQPQGTGKPAVTFTRQAAQRIAKVVRTVEQGDRSQPGLTFDHPVASVGSVLKVGTFTGSWGIGVYKVVTLQGSTQTANVYNWCSPIGSGDTSNTTSSRYVVFGRAGGTNSVVEIQQVSTSSTCVTSFGGIDLTQLAGYSASQIQVLGHNTTGPCLQWYSVTTCSTSTAA